MNCPNCNHELTKSNINYDDEDLFVSNFFCFDCKKLYTCHSWSGDFIEENLEEIGEIS